MIGAGLTDCGARRSLLTVATPGNLHASRSGRLNGLHSLTSGNEALAVIEL
jgi:hypothetical protein